MAKKFIKISLSELIFLTRLTKWRNKFCCDTCLFESFHLIPNMTIFEQLWTLTFYAKTTFDPDFRKHKTACKICSNGQFKKKLKSFGIVGARRIRSDGKWFFLHSVIFIDWMYCDRQDPKISDCLSVCVSVSVWQNHWADFNETFQNDPL